MSYNPISYTEILAYSQLMGEQLSIWDVSAIKMIDLAALAKISENEASYGS
jgi:hypothetical protein